MKTFKKIFLLFGFFYFFVFCKTALATDPINQWISLTNLPFVLANHPSTVSFTKLFTFGGSTSFVRSDTISCPILSDGSLLNWETSISTFLPENLFWHSLINSGNYVYILGGVIYPNNLVNSVSTVLRGSFDPSGNITEWKEMTSLPKRLAGGSAVVVGNKIYYSGGGTWTNGGTPVLSDSLYVSEIQSDGSLSDWQTLNPLPDMFIQHTLIETGKKLIIIGGTNTTNWNPLSKVYSAPINSDGSIGNWTEITALKYPNRYPMINKIGNIVVLAGGVTNNGVTNDVYYSEIDSSGDTGEWIQSSNSLPKITCCTGSAVWNDYMYITGGHNGTGDPGNYYDSVWMAKINQVVLTPTPTPTSTPIPTLTPTPTPQTPVVFLPGLGASFNFKEMFLGISNIDDWVMTPGAKVYDNIIKAFENYPNFYVFNYDWKKSVEESALDLNNFIKNDVKPWNNKVYLVGHSLGGLVARTCVQKTDNACFAEKLITVGSPNKGAVQIYPVVEAGEVWGSNIVDIYMKILIHYHQKPFETSRETALRIAPISLDLLPTFDFLKRNGSIVPWIDLSVKNPLLPKLNDISTIENITTNLYGQSFQTFGSIDVVERSVLDKILGNWEDGKPVNKNFEDGDGTVLVKSAIINSPQIDKFSFNFDHSQLISDKIGIQKIFETLNIPFPNIDLQPARDEKDYLIFFAHSPVELSSPDTNSESFINPEMIIIPNPVNKNYTLKIKGLSNGRYSLSVGQIYGENTQWSDYFNEIKSGETQNFSFSINPHPPAGGPKNPLVDPKGTNTQNFIRSIVNDLKNEINNLTLSKDRKNLLLASLVLIKADKPEVSLIPLYLFRATVALYEKGNLISTEKANYFRNRSSQISGFLETLAFLSPKVTKSNVAQNSLSLSQKAKNSVKINNLSKNSAQVYLEAEEKFKNSQDSFANKDYYKTKIFSSEAASLYTESKNIK